MDHIKGETYYIFLVLNKNKSQEESYKELSSVDWLDKQYPPSTVQRIIKRPGKEGFIEIVILEKYINKLRDMGYDLYLYSSEDGGYNLF